MSVRRTRVPNIALPAAAVRVTRSTDQTIPHSTLEPLSFDTEDYDTDGMWTVGTPTRITIQTAGKYAVGATFVADLDADTTLAQVTLELNGTDTLDAWTVPSLGVLTDQAFFRLHTDIDLVATDYLRILVFQTQTIAGSLIVLSNQPAFPVFYAHRFA